MLTWDGFDHEWLPFKLTTNPKVGRDESRQSLLRPWKDKWSTQSEWKDIVACLYDEEDEYTWKNHFGQDASPPWVPGQQASFKLKTWNKENAPSRLMKRPPPSDGRHDPLCPPPSLGPTDPSSTSRGTSDSSSTQNQSHSRPMSTRKAAITIQIEDREFHLSVKPRSVGDESVRLLAREQRIDLPGFYHAQVIFGKGEAAKY